MTVIPFNTEYGQIIGLEVLPASDGSGAYVLVVRLDNANIDIGTVSVAQTYNVTPPVLGNGDMIGFQSDVNGNLKVNIAAFEEGVSIGTVSQGEPGDIPWPVAVESLPSLPAGTNSIGGIYQTPTSSASFAITPGSSSELESAHVLKESGGNLYSVYINTTSVSGYLMTFNATAVPPDGSVTPVEAIPVGASSIGTINFTGGPPDHYSNGIVVVFS